MSRNACQFEFETYVTEVRHAADEVVTLTLAAVDGGNLPAWTPGSHIDIATPAGPDRQYSLCGPAKADTWRLAIRRHRDRTGASDWLHANVQPRTRLRVRGPKNHFELVDAPSYLFVAAGIGITPIRPMVEAVADRGLDWRLVYGGRTRTSMPFLEELNGMGPVEIWATDVEGRIDLAAAFSEVQSDVAVYCCGPESLIGDVAQACAEYGLQPPRVERFSIDAASGQSEPSGFAVLAGSSGPALDVGPDESILEVLERSGFDPASSCREGACGTCETRVLEGTIDHRDFVLSEEERRAGDTMMICVSRALSDRLVLDI